MVKKANPPSAVKVLRDSREQLGWNFEESAFCLGTEEVTLPTGDYTLAGWENTFIIERKGSVSEFAKNVNEERFRKELERLSMFKHAYLILEFSPEEMMRYPTGSGLPKKLLKEVRVRGPYLMKKVAEYGLKYGVKVQWAGSLGKELSLSLFKRIVEEVPRERPGEQATSTG